MRLNFARISHLRCLSDVELHFSPSFNVFFGENGSGKTSILEGLYFLSAAKSFRSHVTKRVIQDTEQAVFVYGEGERGGVPFSIGIQKTTSSDVQMKINGDDIREVAAMARFLPIIVSGPDLPELANDISARIKWMDWGLFHVKQFYLDFWRKMKHVHAQRNAALKNRLFLDSLEYLDFLWVEISEQIAKDRMLYIDSINQFCLSHDYLGLHELSMAFYRGWEGDLKAKLIEGRDRELSCGYSVYGIHRCDLKILFDDFDARHFLSRGQKKKVDFQLKLAQGANLTLEGGVKSIFLLDDVVSEYDKNSLSMVVQQLFQNGFQVFLSGVDRSIFDHLLEDYPHKMFHVKHGKVLEI